MYSSLQDAGISPAKCVFAGEQWQILLLDSQVFGVMMMEQQQRMTFRFGSQFGLQPVELKLA
jgi:hypothetical protein